MPHPPYHTVTPRMIVEDVEGAAAFLRATFGATGEVVPGRPTELRIGDSLVMVSDGRDPFPALLYVYVDDADEAHQRALAAGGTSVEEPQDQPWGDRRAIVRDKYGNAFQIAHRQLTG
jgi:PhnB protein